MPVFSPPARSASGSLRLFLRFAGIAGLGWLLDAALLLAMVTALGIQPGPANVVSSCTAAVSVFLLSRQTVFARASHLLLARVAGYVCYTLVLILAASFVLETLQRLLAPAIAGVWAPQHAAAAATAAAKVLVTPPQLALNFLVSRFLIERRVA